MHVRAKLGTQVLNFDDPKNAKLINQSYFGLINMQLYMLSDVTLIFIIHTYLSQYLTINGGKLRLYACVMWLVIAVLHCTHSMLNRIIAEGSMLMYMHCSDRNTKKHVCVQRKKRLYMHRKIELLLYYMHRASQLFDRSRELLRVD